MATKKLDRFNTLPPRPEHLKKVKSLLGRGAELKVAELVDASGLSRTQVLCALEALVNEGAAAKKVDPLRFSIINKKEASDSV